MGSLCIQEHFNAEIVCFVSTLFKPPSGAASHYSRKRFDFDHQFGFFLFCLKVFQFFFFELSIFFKFSNNGVKYFTAECLFSAPLYKVSIKLFTGSVRISQIRFVSSHVHLWDGRSFSISLYFILFYFQFKFFIFSNL